MRQAHKSKRSRTGEIKPTSLTNSMLLEYTPKSTTSVRTSKKGEQVTIYGKSNVTHKRNGFTFGDVMNIIAPIYKVILKTHGHNQFGRAVPTLITSKDDAVTVLNRSEFAGTLRTIKSVSGKQSWTEFLGLPSFDPNRNATICSVEDLMAKVNADTSHLSTNTTLTLLSDGALERQLQYNGGSQTHTFSNMVSSVVYIELWELHPRHPMAGFDNVGTYNSIGAQVLTDITTGTNVGLTAGGGNATFPRRDSTRYDDVNDINVTITPDLATINAKFKISKPIKVKLAPGDVFTYKMVFPSFKLTNSDWNYLQGGVTSIKNQLIPGFSKILCMRTYGEIGTNDPTLGTNFTSVGPLPTQITHQQIEYHNVRSIPWIERLTTNICDYQDVDGITTGVNPETNVHDTIY